MTHFDRVFEAKRLPRPSCAQADQPIHAQPLGEYQDLHFFRSGASIHAALPGIGCSECGGRGDSDVQHMAMGLHLLWSLWARKCSSFSRLLDASAVTLAGMLWMQIRPLGALLGVIEVRSLLSSAEMVASPASPYRPAPVQAR